LPFQVGIIIKNIKTWRDNKVIKSKGSSGRVCM
jgi:hypothetical protein